MGIEVFKRFVEVDAELKDLKERIEQVQAEKDDLEKQGIDLLTEMGVDRLTTHGRTFSIREYFYPKPKEGMKEIAMKALKRAKLGMFVTESTNSRTLGSFIKDLQKEGKAIPKVFNEFFDLSPVYKLGSTKS